MVLLNNRSILEISNIFFHQNIVHLEDEKHEIKGLLYDNPCYSSELKTWELKTNEVRAVRRAPITSLDSKLIKLCVNFDVNENKRVFVIPLLHCVELE